MTGYGKAICKTEKGTYNIELRTLNSKQADITIKAPSYFYELEAEIRNLLIQKLERGKIQFTITAIDNNNQGIASINIELAKEWHKQVNNLIEKTGIESKTELIPLLLNMPGVIDTNSTTIAEGEKNIIIDAVKETIIQNDNFRIEEGDTLRKDLINRIGIILRILEEIKNFEEARITKIEEKIRKDFNKFSVNIELDENRLAQELFYYIEKIDITEEKTRLSKHCSHFIETIEAEFTSGKKLSFIAQEIGREINTIGSKANDYEIQHRVVQMKDELEKIKEQLFNIL